MNLQTEKSTALPLTAIVIAIAALAGCASNPSRQAISLPAAVGWALGQNHPHG